MLGRRQAVLLRIIVGQYDYHDKRPLAECLLINAKQMNLQNGTVVQGRMGFKCADTASAPKSFYGLWDTLVIVELVGTPEQVETFIAASGPLLANARVTMHEVTAVFD